jgi:multiple sugar transport system substrate-binding protein
MGRLTLAAVAAALALSVAACGDDEGASGGTPTLNFYTFTAGTAGLFEQAVQRCNERAEGRYRVSIEELPPNADDQREQLARRLAAQDSSIDIVALDVIFTGEFAEAEWIVPFPEDQARRLTEGSIPSTVETGRYQGRLYAVPFTSNTQLLWYRKDRVPEPPRTWDQLVEQAERIGRPGTIQVQGQEAEGFVVWVNSLLASAEAPILRGPTEVALPDAPTRRALEVLRNVTSSRAADPSLTTQAEDQNRLAFETGNPTFMVNYPFIYPSAEENAPEVFRNIEAARYPAIDEGTPSKPPLGGLNFAVSQFSENREEAFDAVGCLVGDENQLAATELGGLPPTKTALFDSQQVREAYPGFADLMLESIQAAAPRPATPAYADLSLAIRARLHPPAEVDPQSDVKNLRDTIDDALNSEGLIG